MEALHGQAEKDEENESEMDKSRGDEENSEKSVEENSEKPVDNLSRLHNILKEPIPEKPSAKYITDTAQQIVENLNSKRKNDFQLMEQFRQALDNQTSKTMEKLEKEMCRLHDAQSAQVDQKLCNLFARLDNIAAKEADMKNFRDSLASFYKEINFTESKTEP